MSPARIFVRGRFGSRSLALAIAVTGIVATMPYIALQLVGMEVVLAALGIHGEWPLIIAFVILAAYTYSSGFARAGDDRGGEGHSHLRHHHRRYRHHPGGAWRLCESLRRRPHPRS